MAKQDHIDDFARLPIDPITVRIPMAVKLAWLSRSRLYEFIQSGEIETIKIGASTFIPYESLRSFIETYRVCSPKRRQTDPKAMLGQSGKR